MLEQECHAVFQRFRVLVVVSLIAFLIGFPAGPVNAGEPSCDATCEQQQVTWYLASLVTQERMWYGAVIMNQPWARCIVHRESRGDMYAENAVSTASGLFQFLDGTWDNVALARGRPDLLGHASHHPWYEQAASAGYLFERASYSPWGGSCG